MKILPFLLYAIFLLCACSASPEAPRPSIAEQAAVAKDAAEPAALPEVTPASSTTNVPGWPPAQACHFLADISGMAPSGGYSQLYEGVHSCGTRYKHIGTDNSSALANNLSYYAAGTPDTVRRLRLLLNINQPSNDTLAREQLAAAAAPLFHAATGDSLPASIHAAIKNAVPGQWDESGYRIELKKDVWPTGKGYELNFVIRDPNFEDIR